MDPALLADLIVIFHLFYVGFTVGGEALILTGALFRWKWVRNRVFRISHLASCLLVAVEAIVGVLCPLTDWEYTLRSKAGQSFDRDLTFIARIVHRIIFYDFPTWVFTAAYLGFGALVILTLLIVPPGRKNPTVRS
jgi:hypothetical protein